MGRNRIKNSAVSIFLLIKYLITINHRKITVIRIRERTFMYIKQYSNVAAKVFALIIIVSIVLEIVLRSSASLFLYCFLCILLFIDRPKVITIKCRYYYY